METEMGIPDSDDLTFPLWFLKGRSEDRTVPDTEIRTKMQEAIAQLESANEDMYELILSHRWTGAEWELIDKWLVFYQIPKKESKKSES